MDDCLQIADHSTLDDKRRGAEGHTEVPFRAPVKTSNQQLLRQYVLA